MELRLDRVRLTVATMPLQAREHVMEHGPPHGEKDPSAWRCAGPGLFDA